MINAILLQARMGSHRLPKKTLKPIGGRPMLAHVLDRLSLVAGVDVLAIITSLNPGDEPICEWCSLAKIPCFRGSEENVLERYVLAARHFRADTIVRATGDNPFVEPHFAGKLLKDHLGSGADYSSNKSEVGAFLPDGLGVEIFTSASLEESLRNATRPNHFEHVNEYILEHKPGFRIHADLCKEVGTDCSAIRLTVDTQADFDIAERIILTPEYRPSVDFRSLLGLIR